MSQKWFSPFKIKIEQPPFFIYNSFPPLLCITVSITHRGCPVVDQDVCDTISKRVRLLKLVPSQALCVPLVKPSSKSEEKDGVPCDVSQTSLNKIGSSEKEAVKHAVEPGVNVLLASHSLFRDVPQITVWEHLTATPEADVK